MKHKINRSHNEKLKAWIDICDFSFRVMEKTLSKEEIEKRINKIKILHSENNKHIFTALGKITYD